eukprot:gnl/TRDRNA2_/TRDRNA2_157883_c0_seq1.p1 gnl/TRDRNA2_/TRDRNA2_157883_c0~~gnl/TRDRNA2_/TRDRNA2_157883_c0_seq1.p1  ORF type:complete len:310 (+),score=36.51 gnl/TRDRNA2_/TRDRNA2_157883_c0_seq1:59-988(+)
MPQPPCMEPLVSHAVHFRTSQCCSLYRCYSAPTPLIAEAVTAAACAGSRMQKQPKQPKQLLPQPVPNCPSMQKQSTSHTFHVKPEQNIGHKWIDVLMDVAKSPSKPGGWSLSSSSSTSRNDPTTVNKFVLSPSEALKSCHPVRCWSHPGGSGTLDGLCTAAAVPASGSGSDNGEATAVCELLDDMCPNPADKTMVVEFLMTQGMTTVDHVAEKPLNQLIQAANVAGLQLKHQIMLEAVWSRALMSQVGQKAKTNVAEDYMEQVKRITEVRSAVRHAENYMEQVKQKTTAAAKTGLPTVVPPVFEISLCQ